MRLPLLALAALAGLLLAPGAAVAHDDGALVHLDLSLLYACVGPWFSTHHEHLGPVVVTYIVCEPPGDPS